MSYEYKTEKPFVFSENGQAMFLRIRDRVKSILKLAGCIRMQEAIMAGGTGSNWSMIACVDRLVEIGELREITGSDVPGQYRIFVGTQD